MHSSPGRPIDAPGPDHPATDGPGAAAAVPVDPGRGDDATPAHDPTPDTAHSVGPTPDTAPTDGPTLDGPAPDGPTLDGDRRDPYQPL